MMTFPSSPVSVSVPKFPTDTGCTTGDDKNCPRLANQFLNPFLPLVIANVFTCRSNWRQEFAGSTDRDNGTEAREETDHELFEQYCAIDVACQILPVFFEFYAIIIVKRPQIEDGGRRSSLRSRGADLVRIAFQTASQPITNTHIS